MMQWLMLQQKNTGGLRDRHRRAAFGARVRRRSPRARSGSRSAGRARGMEEKGYDTATGNCIVAVDPRYFRPTEVETLLGDPSKSARKARLAAPHQLRRAGARDDARRPQGSRERRPVLARGLPSFGAQRVTPRPKSRPLSPMWPPIVSSGIERRHFDAEHNNFPKRARVPRPSDVPVRA